MKEHKKTSLSFVTGFVLFFFVGILGLFKMQIFISQFGKEFNGAYQSFSQITIYLGLLESGMAAVVLSQLYKPMHENNDFHVASIMEGARSFWIKLGYIIFIVGFLSIPIFGLIIRDLPIELFLIMSVCFIARVAFISFFYDSQVLVIANNRVYLTTLAVSLGIIISTIAAIGTAIFLHNPMITILTEAGILILGYIISYYIFRNMYKKYYINSIKPDYAFKKELKGTSTLRITEAITNNTDILVISSILGSGVVSTFAAYNSLVTMLFLSLSVMLTDSVKSLLGKAYADKKHFVKFVNIYDAIKTLNFALVLFVIPIMFTFIKPFVELFFSQNDKESIIFVAICCLYFYMRLLRSPNQALKIATNTYNQFRKVAITNALLNLSLSIIFTKIVGISGVLLGSMTALVITEFWYEIKVLEINNHIYTLKNIINQYTKNLVLTGVVSFLFYLIFTPYLTSFIAVFSLAFLAAFVNLVIVVLVYGKKIANLRKVLLGVIKQ